MRRAYCPNDGRYVSNVVAHIAGFGGEDGIQRVTATCKRCGDVKPEIEDGWAWEDFEGEEL